MLRLNIENQSTLTTTTSSLSLVPNPVINMKPQTACSDLTSDQLYQSLLVATETIAKVYSMTIEACAFKLIKDVEIFRKCITLYAKSSGLFQDAYLDAKQSNAQNFAVLRCHPGKGIYDSIHPINNIYGKPEVWLIQTSHTTNSHQHDLSVLVRRYQPTLIVSLVRMFVPSCLPQKIPCVWSGKDAAVEFFCFLCSNSQRGNRRLVRVPPSQWNRRIIWSPPDLILRDSLAFSPYDLVVTADQIDWRLIGQPRPSSFESNEIHDRWLTNIRNFYSYVIHTVREVLQLRGRSTKSTTVQHMCAQQWEKDFRRLDINWYARVEVHTDMPLDVGPKINDASPVLYDCFRCDVVLFQCDDWNNLPEGFRSQSVKNKFSSLFYRKTSKTANESHLSVDASNKDSSVETDSDHCIKPTKCVEDEEDQTEIPVDDNDSRRTRIVCKDYYHRIRMKKSRNEALSLNHFCYNRIPIEFKDSRDYMEGAVAQTVGQMVDIEALPSLSFQNNCFAMVIQTPFDDSKNLMQMQTKNLMQTAIIESVRNVLEHQRQYYCSFYTTPVNFDAFDKSCFNLPGIPRGVPFQRKRKNGRHKKDTVDQSTNDQETSDVIDELSETKEDDELIDKDHEPDDSDGHKSDEENVVDSAEPQDPSVSLEQRVQIARTQRENYVKAWNNGFTIPQHTESNAEKYLHKIEQENFEFEHGWREDEDLIPFRLPSIPKQYIDFDDPLFYPPIHNRQEHLIVSTSEIKEPISGPVNATSESQPVPAPVKTPSKSDGDMKQQVNAAKELIIKDMRQQQFSTTNQELTFLINAFKSARESIVNNAQISMQDETKLIPTTTRVQGQLDLSIFLDLLQHVLICKYDLDAFKSAIRELHPNWIQENEQKSIVQPTRKKAKPNDTNLTSQNYQQILLFLKEKIPRCSPETMFQLEDSKKLIVSPEDDEKKDTKGRTSLVKALTRQPKIESTQTGNMVVCKSAKGPFDKDYVQGLLLYALHLLLQITPQNIPNQFEELIVARPFLARVDQVMRLSTTRFKFTSRMYLDTRNIVCTEGDASAQLIANGACKFLQHLVRMTNMEDVKTTKTQGKSRNQKVRESYVKTLEENGDQKYLNLALTNESKQHKSGTKRKSNESDNTTKSSKKQK